MVERIAIVGAGMAGLACAGRLAGAGREVALFDKARGPSGRCATRRTETRAFDHGAQYFTARGEAFREAVDAWCRAGAAAAWPGRLMEQGPEGTRTVLPDEPRFVGAPRMSALGRHLASGLSLTASVRVARLERDDAWWLCDEQGERHGPFDAVALAVPAPQAVPLLGEFEAFAARLAAVRLSPCWAAMVAWDEPPSLDFDALALPHDPVLAWVANNDAKPGRPPTGSFTLHGSVAFSEDRLEAPAEEVAAQLLARFAEILERRLPEPVHQAAHRWRYALVAQPLGEAFLWDAEARLGVCGDGCIAPRVEAAWTSGAALADAMLAHAS